MNLVLSNKYKYRGISKKFDKRFFYGNLLFEYSKYYIQDIVNNKKLLVEIDEDTICQCTGKKSDSKTKFKNLYENDKILINDKIGIIKWSNPKSRFVIKFGELDEINLDSDFYELIGNIYE